MFPGFAAQEVVNAQFVRVLALRTAAEQGSKVRRGWMRKIGCRSVGATHQNFTFLHLHFETSFESELQRGFSGSTHRTGLFARRRLISAIAFSGESFVMRIPPSASHGVRINKVSFGSCPDQIWRMRSS